MFKGKESDKEMAKLGKQIIMEHDLEIPITYKDEIFTLQYPTPLMRSAIENEIARRLGGYARDTYAPQHLQLIESTVYVNELYIQDKCPKWFKSAWLCYDDELIQELYAGYLLFRGEFQEKVRSDKFQGSSQINST